MNALRNSEFDPKQLKVEDVEDGYENCSYFGKDQEMKTFVAPRVDDDEAIAGTAIQPLTQPLKNDSPMMRGIALHHRTRIIYRRFPRNRISSWQEPLNLAPAQ